MTHYLRWPCPIIEEHDTHTQIANALRGRPNSAIRPSTARGWAVAAAAAASLRRSPASHMSAEVDALRSLRDGTRPTSDTAGWTHDVEREVEG
jgi:hypothetical protein